VPLFDFVCRDCGHEQEILIRGSETPACQACGGAALAKLLSAPIARTGGAGAEYPAPGAGGGCGPGCGCH
jgi:putative FmdB family regulatory protein